MSQTEDSSLEDSLSYDPEELFQRRMVFSTVLERVRTKTIKQVKDTFLQGLKKQTGMSTASQYGLGTWEGSLIKSKEF